MDSRDQKNKKGGDQMVNHLQNKNTPIDPELNLLINALESAIDLCQALGKDPAPFQQKLQEVVVPVDRTTTRTEN